jgi:peptidyl-prolyl cis-trans isomerase A (cyclophilin A)
MIAGMDRRFALLAAPLALLLLAAAPHRAVHHAAPAAPTKPLPDAVRVVLTTTMGPIVVEVDVKHAPITATNFVRYVDQRRFDGIVFYRAMHLPWGDPPNGLIQAGTQGDPKRILKPIAHEPTSMTGLLHKTGWLSMARFAPGTATGDFSILVSDQPGLDADPKGTTPDAQAGFAVFGHVVEGMEVVRKVWDAPLSATKGEGVMKGQMLAAPVRIVTARRVPVPGQVQAAQ